MNHIQSKIKAVIEVLFVFFIVFFLIGVLFASPLGEWERNVLHRGFLEYALMIILPLLLLAGTRKNLSAYGISFKKLKYHIDVALTCFIPYAVFHAVLFAISLENQQLDALFSAALAVGLLFVFGWLLRKKPTVSNLCVLSVFFFLIPGIFPSSGQAVEKAISAFVFYFIFLGPGEEVLFRGYIQSRLNTTFGCPYHFFGVNWGWGLVITSVLFGFMHVLNLPALFTGHIVLKWWTGLSIFFWGFVFGFLREKTGSIVAPAIIHGLPQAIAYAFLGL